MQTSEAGSLHILPLLHMPLETQSLRQARLVKNSRLESMIELFGEKNQGSGQVQFDQLHAFFDFTGQHEQDLDIIYKLGKLPSYDVYSLRVSLRHLDIDIENLGILKLSDTKVAELTKYMTEFTRPLLRFVYETGSVELVNLSDLHGLFVDPEASTARKNLRRMAGILGVDLTRIPKFLEDYADVYMSLSFYRQCLERIRPLLGDFIESLGAIRSARNFADERALLRDCDAVEVQLNGLFEAVSGILDEFRNRTENIWDDLSAERYRQMELMVLDHQTRIGEVLCALTVKMNAWNEKFPVRGDGQLSAKAAFAISEMKHGLSQIRPLTFQIA